jgi:hypothetical protein
MFCIVFCVRKAILIFSFVLEEFCDFSYFFFAVCKIQQAPTICYITIC